MQHFSLMTAQKPPTMQFTKRESEGGAHEGKKMDPDEKVVLLAARDFNTSTITIPVPKFLLHAQ